MPHVPFVAAVVGEQFRAGHEKDSPTMPPQGRIVAAIAVCKNRQDAFFVAVHTGKPRIARLSVVLAVPMPTALDTQVIAKTQR